MPTIQLIYLIHESEAAAQRISNLLLAARLVACANIFPIQSAYCLTLQGERPFSGCGIVTNMLWFRIRRNKPVVCYEKTNLSADSPPRRGFVARVCPTGEIKKGAILHGNAQLRSGH